MAIQHPSKIISSAANERLKTFRTLLTSKGIKNEGQFLISGEKFVREALKFHLKHCKYVLSSEKNLTLLQALNPPLESIQLSHPLFAELDAFGTDYPLLVAELPPLKPWQESLPVRGLEIFCALSEPTNVGALVRSAAAFSATKIVLLKESAFPFHPKAVRAAAGQTLNVEFEIGPSISDLDIANPHQWLGLGMSGTPLNEFKWPQDIRLLVGQEGLGLPAAWPGKTITIPMNPDVESLNATVATSIALYTYSTQRPKNIS